MSAQVRGQRRSRLRRILRGMRLNFITLGLLIVLTVLGLSLIRTSPVSYTHLTLPTN